MIRVTRLDRSQAAPSLELCAWWWRPALTLQIVLWRWGVQIMLGPRPPEPFAPTRPQGEPGA